MHSDFAAQNKSISTLWPNLTSLWHLGGFEKITRNEKFVFLLMSFYRRVIQTTDYGTVRLWWLYLHMLANIPDRRLARSWISLILSLISVIPSLIWSDSDFLTGLDWSMIVHSDSWTFLSSKSQEPTGPDVGRSFMLKCNKIFDNFHRSDPFIMFGRVIYIIGFIVWAGVAGSRFRMTNSQTFIFNVWPGQLKDATLTFVGL